MMDDPERVILDISSDEEVGIVKTKDADGGGGGGGKGCDDYAWITELLGEGGDGRSKDDSDDVVVVREVIMNSKQNIKSLTNANDDDDDCVVLEEDPDKPVEVENDKDDDSDDLLVVSEKGQIACRDYPHSRHLCAKFPFGSTSHERHCDQCHCYVCDTLAPCVYWRTGISSIAHCHATDKDKFWRTQRQNTRKGDKVPPPVTPCRGTSVSVPPPVTNQAPGFIQRLPNYPPHNEAFRPASIRPCSMSSSPGLPNSTRQVSTALRDKFHSHVVSQQFRNASINVNPGDRRHNVGHRGSQFFTTRTAFKRVGSSGQAFATDISGYNSPNSCSVPQFGRTHSSAARWQVPCGSRPVGSNRYIASSQHNTGIHDARAVPYQPQLQRQPGFVGVPANYAPMGPQMPSQPNAAILGANAVSSQHQLLQQPALVGASTNYAPMEPEIPSQPSAGRVRSNAVSFQPRLPTQPRFVGAPANNAPMEPQILSETHVSVCANSASSETPTFFPPYANSSPSQPHLSTFPSVLSEFESLVSSENSIASQSQVDNMYNNSLSSEAQMFSQQYADGNSVNNLPQQTSVAFDPEGGNTSVNTTASQYLLACPTNAGTALGDLTTTVSQLSNQPDGGTSPNSSVPCHGNFPSSATTESTFGSRCENTFSCQPELCRQHISSSSSDGQNISQHGYQVLESLRRSLPGPAEAAPEAHLLTKSSRKFDPIVPPEPEVSPVFELCISVSAPSRYKFRQSNALAALTMALWMEAGSEPKTEKELADLDAISALKESAAFELKEKGNEYVKMGKKHYSDAIDCYTRAVNQNALSDAEQSILYSNRAHVNLLLGNYRRALQDAEDAIKLNPSNVKALYRAAKAAFSLNLLTEAKGLCEKGLQHSSSNEELKKIAKQIDIQKSEMERRDAEVSKAVSSAKALVSAFEIRGLKIGKPMYQELTGLKKPTLDKNNILRWPVLLLYPEVMSSDFIEEFCETDMFSAHFDMMFSEGCQALPWDKENAYTRDAVELYYEACAGVCLSKQDILWYLLEGTAASHVEDFGDEESGSSRSSSKDSISQADVPRWVKINEKRTLYNVLKEPSCVVPGIPVFWVVSRNSSFYKDFKSGNWSPPELA